MGAGVGIPSLGAGAVVLSLLLGLPWGGWLDKLRSRTFKHPLCYLCFPLVPFHEEPRAKHCSWELLSISKYLSRLEKCCALISFFFFFLGCCWVFCLVLFGFCWFLLFWGFLIVFGFLLLLGFLVFFQFLLEGLV